jgi:hypothetical protein
MVCSYRVFIPDRDRRSVFFDDPAFNIITAEWAIRWTDVQICHAHPHKVNKIGVTPFPHTFAVARTGRNEMSRYLAAVMRQLQLWLRAFNYAIELIYRQVPGTAYDRVQ